MTAEQSTGVWGYSGPNPRHVIFCADLGYHDITVRIIQQQNLWAKQGTGAYKGVNEQCIIMQVRDFMFIRDLIQGCIRRQESVLRLGTLGSQNWRKADLIYNPLLNDIERVDNTASDCEDVGTWHEITQKEAVGRVAFTAVDGHYYGTDYNPPRTEQDKIERHEAQVLFDLHVAALVLLKVARGRKKSAKDIPAALFYCDQDGPFKHNNGLHAMLASSNVLEGRVLENGKTFNAGMVREAADKIISER